MSYPHARISYPHGIGSLRLRLRCAVSLCAACVAALFLCALPSTAAAAPAAAAPSSAPDVIVFTNGDKLAGKLLGVTSGTVTFHSDAAGDIKVTWDKIKSIHSSQRFAVVRKGQKISRAATASEVPQGTVNVENQQIEITPEAGGAPVTVPTADADFVIDEATFNKEAHGHPGWLQDWTGSATAGIALVEATQNSRSFNTAIVATRKIPDVIWLAPRQRTTLGLNDVYGSLSQPGTPTSKTSLFHAAGEQDWYLSPRFFALATAIFDHDYSQGLDLQQIYGGGFGFTAFKSARQELDLKGDLHFERQSFGQTPGVVPPVITPSKNLVGIDAGDTYARKLAHSIAFNQSLVVTPALNDVKAFSAVFNAALTFPVYKRVGFSTGVLDSFLNDPAFGSKRNSFQFTGGVTYTF